MPKKKSKKVICPQTDNVECLTEDQAKNLLTDLMSKLDDLAMDDFFGTEGWRHYLGYED